MEKPPKRRFYENNLWFEWNSSQINVKSHQHHGPCGRWVDENDKLKHDLHLIKLNYYLSASLKLYKTDGKAYIRDDVIERKDIDQTDWQVSGLQKSLSETCNVGPEILENWEI